MSSKNQTLKKTPLHDWHVEYGAKMIPFAGYEMPLQYGNGILSEHRHTRQKVSLFDISHMGQATIHGKSVFIDFEELVPGDIMSLNDNRSRYTQLTNERGGIIDDLIITKHQNYLTIVVNAGCKDKDYSHINSVLGRKVEIEPFNEMALLALQGPDSATLMARLAPGAELLPFMSSRQISILGITCNISRSGYTGEDGYEISVSKKNCRDLVEVLMAEPGTAPAGIGARDILRLEAGLCLYGNDLDEKTTPIEAGLLWSISKRRQEKGGFLGDATIIEQIKNQPDRRRIGILLEGKVPARAQTNIVNALEISIGSVTSGNFSPSINTSIAMGYVLSKYSELNTKMGLIVRGKRLEAKAVRMPFLKHRYYRPQTN